MATGGLLGGVGSAMGGLLGSGQSVGNALGQYNGSQSTWQGNSSSVAAPLPNYGGVQPHIPAQWNPVIETKEIEKRRIATETYTDEMVDDIVNENRLLKARLLELGEYC
jgi:hypothetical protein